MRNNLGHITRGDPVYRTRKMLEKEIADLERQLPFAFDEEDRAEIEYELDQARQMLDSLNSCFV